MAKRIFFGLLLMICPLLASAQTAPDVVELKNGTLYKGNITAYIPNEKVTILLLDGTIQTIAIAEIRNLSMGDRILIEKNFDLKEKGYFFNMNLGPQFGKMEEDAVQVALSWQMVNGYYIGGHHPGIGIGLDNYAGGWYLPIYLAYSYQFRNQRFSPFAGMEGGITLPLEIERSTGYYRNHFEKGVFIGGRAGLVIYNNPNFAFQLSLSYKYAHLEGKDEIYYVIMPSTFERTRKADIHRLGVSIGFLIK